MTIDLLILPIHRRDGRDQQTPPGLHTALPPRRITRSRRGDQLILYLAFTGTATISTEGQTKLLDRLAATYYQTPGAVTTALRVAAESLNNFLLDRNLRSANKGLQTAGLLTILVHRHGRLYIAQSGPAHVFIVEAAQTRQIHDPKSTGHGLGLGRATAMHIAHLPLEPGNLVVISPNPPAAWTTESMQAAHKRNLNSIHRGLLKSAGPDLVTILVQAQTGEGKLRLIKPPSHPVVGVEDKPAGSPPPAASKLDRDPAFEQDDLGRKKPATRQGEAPEESPPPPEPAPNLPHKPIAGPMLLTVGRAFRNAARQVWNSARALLTRILPGTELFTIPSNVMAFIAVAVPLVLVVIASVVYLRRGRLGQYETYIQYAEAAKTNAEGKTGLEEKRTAWGAVIFYIDQAEQYQTTTESHSLRLRAQTELDQLESIERLEFQPILEGELSDSLIVKRIVATREDLYLLNANGGSVVRAWLSGSGYEPAPEFRCGPGSYGSYSVSELIDIAPLPQSNNYEANLLAMDANGILVYCLHDQPPIAVQLPPPDSSWGNPTAFALDSGVLYVLDPQTNAVWVYQGDDYSFTERPRFFFDEQVPSMKDVTDLAVDRGELFMLHEDSHITICTFGFGDRLTDCTAPAQFTDPRAGRQDGPFLEGAALSQITFTPPPDPSIYLFDPFQPAVYHLSLRLTLQRQYRPQILGGPAQNTPATTFALSPNRTVFLAVDNQVYVATLP